MNSYYMNLLSSLSLPSFRISRSAHETHKKLSVKVQFIYDMWLSANNKNKLKQNRQTNKQTDKHKKGLDKRTLSAKKTSLLNPDSWDKRPILTIASMRLSGSCPSIKLLTLVCITSTEKLGNQLAIWEPFKEKLWKVWCTSHEEFSFICFSQKKPVLIKHFQQTSCIRILSKVDNFNFERTGSHTHVVVQFNPWFKFYFPLFFWYGNVW